MSDLAASVTLQMGLYGQTLLCLLTLNLFYISNNQFFMQFMVQTTTFL